MHRGANVRTLQDLPKASPGFEAMGPPLPQDYLHDFSLKLGFKLKSHESSGAASANLALISARLLNSHGGPKGALPSGECSYEGPFPMKAPGPRSRGQWSLSRVTSADMLSPARIRGFPESGLA